MTSRQNVRKRERKTTPGKYDYYDARRTCRTANNDFTERRLAHADLYRQTIVIVFLNCFLNALTVNNNDNNDNNSDNSDNNITIRLARSVRDSLRLDIVTGVFRKKKKTYAFALSAIDTFHVGVRRSCLIFARVRRRGNVTV